MMWKGYEVTPEERASILIRLYPKKYIDENGCWNWTGFINTDGYGQTSFKHKNTGAHRLMYAAFHDANIPEGNKMQLDHLCKNKRCFNPSHLEIVPARINTLRSENAPATKNVNKTHCLRGHEFTGDNTQFKKGRRICKACRRIYNKDIYDRLYSGGRRREREAANRI